MNAVSTPYEKILVALIPVFIYAGELCSETANDRVLNLELYIHRRQKLTFLHLFTGLFRKEIFPHSAEYLQG